MPSPFPPGLDERLLEETRRVAPAVETDWTKGEGRYSIVLASPTSDGGAVIARIDGQP